MGQEEYEKMLVERGGFRQERGKVGKKIGQEKRKVGKKPHGLEVGKKTDFHRSFGADAKGKT
jgi:hypothetical protein